MKLKKSLIKKLTVECIEEIKESECNVQNINENANVTANVASYLAPMNLDDEELDELVEKIIRAITISGEDYE
jgi:hypothetical protein